MSAEPHGAKEADHIEITKEEDRELCAWYNDPLNLAISLNDGKRKETAHGSCFNGIRIEVQS
jgi:hypothetical protein